MKSIILYFKLYVSPPKENNNSYQPNVNPIKQTFLILCVTYIGLNPKILTSLTVAQRFSQNFRALVDFASK